MEKHPVLVPRLEAASTSCCSSSPAAPAPSSGFRKAFQVLAAAAALLCPLLAPAPASALINGMTIDPTTNIRIASMTVVPTGTIGNQVAAVFTSSGAAVVQSTSATGAYAPLRIITANGRDTIFRVQQNLRVGIATDSVNSTFVVGDGAEANVNTLQAAAGVVSINAGGSVVPARALRVSGGGDFSTGLGVGAAYAGTKVLEVTGDSTFSDLSTFTKTGASSFSLGTSSGISLGGGGIRYADGTFQYSAAAGCVTNCTFNNLTVNGTLAMADGQAITGSITHTSTMTIRCGAGATRCTIGWAASGYGAPSGVGISNGDKLSFFDSAAGAGEKYVLGLEPGFMWFQSAGGGGGAGDGFKWYTGTSNDMTLYSGKLGLGTGAALPATTLEINGDAQFGSGAVKSTFTAAGLLLVSSNTVVVGAIAGRGIPDGGGMGVGAKIGGDNTNALIYGTNNVGAYVNLYQDAATIRLNTQSQGNIVTGSGLFGVSDVTPDARLEVKGLATDGYVVQVSSVGDTVMFGIDKFGHVVSSATNSPSLGTCTNGVLQVPSTDVSGRINFTGANTSCGVNFAFAAQPGQIVNCSVSVHMVTPALVDVQVSGTAITIAATSFANTDYAMYNCIRVGGEGY